MEFDQQFIEYIVKALVNKPEEVTSERKIDEQGVLITVHTAAEDTGYVIGKGGKTAVAIRTLLATLGAKGNLRISFRIDAPDNGKRRGPAPVGTTSSEVAPVTQPVATPVPVEDRDMDEASVDSLTF